MSSNPPREFDRLLQDAPLVRAMGGALSMFATLLARQGIVEASEVANLLGIFAVAQSEVDNEEGMILGCCAAMISDVAEHERTTTRKEHRRARTRDERRGGKKSDR